MGLKGVASASTAIPSGAAGGDLGGTYPSPTVTSVANVTTGTLGLANGGTSATDDSNIGTVIANVQALLLLKTRAAGGRVRAKTGRGKILCIGDSTTFGVFSAGSLTVGDMKTYCYPQQLANYLNSSGVAAEASSFFCAGSKTSPAPSNFFNDGRLVIGSSWTVLTGAGGASIGGNYLQASTNTNSISFTPTVQVDTFDVYYPTQAAQGFGKIQADINGGSATVFDENIGGSFSVTKGTLSASLGANTINIKWNSVATAYLVGIDAYNSAVPSISVLNAGWSGAKVSDVITPGGLAGIAGVAADLTIINIGINDWVVPTAIGTYTANLQTLITACLATGDVILVSPNPSISSSAPVSTQQAYVAAISALAVTNNILFVDVFNRFGGLYTTSNANGFMGDTLHPNGVGYADMAQAIYNALSV